MRIFKTQVVCLLLCTFSLVTFSCDNGDSGEDVAQDLDDSPVGEFTSAQVGGVDYFASPSISDNTVWAVIIPSQSNMLFNANNGNGERIRFEIKNYQGEGVYSFGNTSNENTIRFMRNLGPSDLPNGDWICIGPQASCMVTITKDDGMEVEGTFSFEGFSIFSDTSLLVTEGKFRANIE